MKTLQEVHDMLALTGYKEEAETVAEAIKAVEIAEIMMHSLDKITDICSKVKEDSEAICQ